MARLILAMALSVWAPVPQPRPLTTEMMVGRWDYAWGQMADGWIEFHADGHYVSRHDPGINPTFAGQWLVYEGVLTLKEGRCPCPEEPTALLVNSVYPIQVCGKKYPTVTGTCGVTAVSFVRRN